MEYYQRNERNVQIALEAQQICACVNRINQKKKEAFISYFQRRTAFVFILNQKDNKCNMIETKNNMI